MTLALGATIGFVSAQEKVEQNTTQEPKKVDQVPPATGQSPPDRAGTQQPGAKGAGTNAAGTNAKAAPLVNGSLAVAGAPVDTETTPSKYSPRNAASDQLPIAAFRLKFLTDDQKREIHGRLTGQGGSLALSPGHQDHYAMIGAELPASVALRDLKPVPEDLAAKFPELRGTRYLIDGPSVLIVDINSAVVGVLSAQ
jgi:hypothetical protein